jgi:hypothetical protein
MEHCRAMEMQIRGELSHWRGPSPFHSVPIPAAQSAKIKGLSFRLTYGWGVIPVTVTIGETIFSTSLFPKDGHYLVPTKAAVRTAEAVHLGAQVRLTLTFTLRE